jgi:hypothetical protein
MRKSTKTERERERDNNDRRQDNNTDGKNRKTRVRDSSERRSDEINNGPAKSDAFGSIIHSHNSCNLGRYEAGVAKLHRFIQL